MLPISPPLTVLPLAFWRFGRVLVWALRGRIGILLAPGNNCGSEIHRLLVVRPCFLLPFFQTCLVWLSVNRHIVLEESHVVSEACELTTVEPLGVRVVPTPWLR